MSWDHVGSSPLPGQIPEAHSESAPAADSARLTLLCKVIISEPTLDRAPSLSDHHFARAEADFVASPPSSPRNQEPISITKAGSPSSIASDSDEAPTVEEKASKPALQESHPVAPKEVSSEKVEEALDDKDIKQLANLLIDGRCTLRQETKNRILHFACEEGHIPLMKAMVDGGADLCFQDPDSEKNILHVAVDRAVEENDFEMLLFVAEDLNPADLQTLLEQRSDEKKTPLMQAGSDFREDVVKYLLDLTISKGAMPSQRFEVVEMLLDKKPELLAKFSKEEILEKNQEGNTHLQVAMSDGDCSKIKSCLSLGADHTSKTSDGRGLLEVARQGSHTLLSELILDGKVTATPKDLSTCFQMAIRENNLAQARALLDKFGVDSLRLASTGQTLLNELSHTGKSETLSFLLNELKLASVLHQVEGFAGALVENAFREKNWVACSTFLLHSAPGEVSQEIISGFFQVAVEEKISHLSRQSF